MARSRRPAPLGPQAVREALDVSRETWAAIETYVVLLKKWQRRINLVAASSLDDVWRRHVLDSAQLLRHRQRLALPWYDLGSGAGFPGLVLALLGLGEVRLVESDQRKAAFLAEAIRLTGAPATVLNRRLETLEPANAATITARALAPLPRLLGLAAPLLTSETELWLWKGQDVEVELTEAAKYWKMTIERYDSISDPTGTVLRLREVCRV